MVLPHFSLRSFHVNLVMIRDKVSSFEMHQEAYLLSNRTKTSDTTILPNINFMHLVGQKGVAK